MKAVVFVKNNLITQKLTRRFVLILGLHQVFCSIISNFRTLPNSTINVNQILMLYNKFV